MKAAEAVIQYAQAILEAHQNGEPEDATVWKHIERVARERQARAAA